MSWFCWQQRELQLELQIQPGAKHDTIVGLHGERLKLKIHAPALDGRANHQLIEFLATCFGTAKTNVSIVRGELGRSKSVRIKHVSCMPSELTALGLLSPDASA